jgi:large subunit ribosomal protein L5
MAKDMKTVTLEKVTLNVCVGNDKPGMVKAKKLLEMLTGKTPVMNVAKKRLAMWQLRPGLPIGYKVTLRGEDAKKFLTWCLDSKGNKLKAKSLDHTGNFSLGFTEYLELHRSKYDADIGIMGFELMVTFKRPGTRVKTRALHSARIPLRHKTTGAEVTEILKRDFNTEVTE